MQHKNCRFETSLGPSQDAAQVQLEGVPQCCRLKLVSNESSFGFPLYFDVDRRIEDERGAGSFSRYLIEGNADLIESRALFSFNVDGTISVHPDTMGLKELERPEDARNFVIGWGFNKDDRDRIPGHEGLIHVPAEDFRRLIFSFTFQSSVSGIQKAEWLAVTDIRQLVPLLREPSADRESGKHDNQPLLIKAKPGTGKSWSVFQLHYQLAKACRDRLSEGGVPLVPMLVEVQKLTRMMRMMRASGEANSLDGINLLVRFIERNLRWSVATKAMLLQALEMRAVLLLVDGIDEASDLRVEVEEYFVLKVAPAGVRIVLTSRPEGVQDKLYRSGWVVMDLKKLTEEQERISVGHQLEDDDFYDNLSHMTAIRNGNDRIYDKASFKEAGKTVAGKREINHTLQAANVNHLLWHHPPAGAHVDPADREIYNPERRQRVIDGSRMVERLPEGAPLQSEFLRKFDEEMREHGLLAVLDEEMNKLGPYVQAEELRKAVVKALDSLPPEARAHGREKELLTLADVVKRNQREGVPHYHALPDETASSRWQEIMQRNDELYVVAEALLPVFKQTAMKLVESAKVDDPNEFVLKLAPQPKDPTRLHQKATGDYGARFTDGGLAEACVTDVLRGTVLCASLKGLSRLFTLLTDPKGFEEMIDLPSGEKVLARFECIKFTNKLRDDKMDPTHFRFANCFMELSCGTMRMCVELQAHFQVLYEYNHIAMNSHHSLEYFRNLMPGSYEATMNDILDRSLGFFDTARGIPVQLSMLVLIFVARKKALEEDKETRTPKGILETTTDSLPASKEALYRLAVRSALIQSPKTQTNWEMASNMLRRVATQAVMLPMQREFSADDVKEALQGHDDERALFAKLLDAKHEEKDGPQVPLIKVLEDGEPGLNGGWSFQFKQ